MLTNWIIKDENNAPAGTIINYEEIEVEGINGDPLNPGIRFNFGETMIVDEGDVGFDTTFRKRFNVEYNVETLDANFLIKDISIEIVIAEAIASGGSASASADMHLTHLGLKRDEGNVIGVRVGQDPNNDRLKAELDFQPIRSMVVQHQFTAFAFIGPGQDAFAKLGVVDARFSQVEVAAVPEPTTIALLGIGLVGLAGAEVRRRRKKNAVEKS